MQRGDHHDWTSEAYVGEWVRRQQSDLFETNWLPTQFAPFDAAVSSSCLYNLGDFKRIGEIYGEVHEHLKSGGVFLNVDLINAPTAALHQRYVSIATGRRRREGNSGADIGPLVRGGGRPPAEGTTGPFPAGLDQHLAALTAAGFKDVDCFWKDLRRALVGGYA